MFGKKKFSCFIRFFFHPAPLFLNVRLCCIFLFCNFFLGSWTKAETSLNVTHRSDRDGSVPVPCPCPAAVRPRHSHFRHGGRSSVRHGHSPPRWGHVEGWRSSALSPTLWTCWCSTHSAHAQFPSVASQRLAPAQKHELQYQPPPLTSQNFFFCFFLLHRQTSAIFGKRQSESRLSLVLNRYFKGFFFSLVNRRQNKHSIAIFWKSDVCVFY